MPELLLLTVDSLRADRVDPEHVPACWETFDTEFVRFENALSNGVATPISFPSILTGRPAAGDGTLPASRPTLAELFDGETWAASNNPHLRPDRGYDRGFDRFAHDLESLDGFESIAADVEASRAPERSTDSGDDGPEMRPPPTSAAHVLAALERAMDARRGCFWVHFIDPHYQFKPQKVLDRPIDVDVTDRELLSMNERYVDGTPTDADLAVLESLYDEQVRYLDRRLAAFFDHLRRAGRWEETTIAVLSDHGEAFGEAGVHNHQWDADPIDPLVRVPLLVKFPGGRHGGERRDHLVQNADLLATLADAFGWSVDRPPNTRALRDDHPRIVVSTSNAAVRVTTPDGSAVRRRDGSIDGLESLGSDAREVLESTPIPAVEKLSGSIPGLDGADREAIERRLEALGYR